MLSCRQRSRDVSRPWVTRPGTWPDCGLLDAADEVIRGYAASLGAVIITKDDDFVVHQVLEGGPAVVWIRIGNTRKAELLGRIETDYAIIVVALERGETLVELA